MFDKIHDGKHRKHFIRHCAALLGVIVLFAILTVFLSLRRPLGPKSLYLPMGPSAQILNIDLSPDGQIVAANTASGVDFCVDLNNGKLLAMTEHGGLGESPTIEFMPAGDEIAMRSGRNDVAIWRFRDGTLRKAIHVEGNLVTALSCFANGSRMFVGEGPNAPSILCWDLISSRQVYSLSASTILGIGLSPSTNISDLKCSPDNTTVAFAVSTFIVLAKAADGRFRNSIKLNSLPLRLAYSHDGSILAAVTNTGNVLVWDSKACSVMADYSIPNAVFSPAIMFSQDDRYIVTTANSRPNEPGTIWIWDRAGAAFVASFRSRGRVITSMRTTPNGESIVLSTRDGTIEVWTFSDILRAGACDQDP